MNAKTMNVRKLTTLGMLAGLSVLMVWLIHFPVFPAAPFLEYDPADVPILIATFAYGPLAGLGVTVVASVIQGLTVSAGSGIPGIIMHIAATGAYVIVAGLIYQRKKTRLNAGIALAAGTLAMVVVMAGCNLIITPLFMGTPVQAVLKMMLPIILPFNLIKAGANGLITFAIYKRVANVIRSFGETKKEDITAAS